MNRIDAKEKLKELADQAGEILRNAFGQEAELYISIHKRKYVEVRIWGDPDEEGNYTNAPRRDLLSISGGENGWNVNLTESNNRYYKEAGILLEVDG